MTLLHRQRIPRAEYGPGWPMMLLLGLITAVVVVGGVALWQSGDTGTVTGVGDVTAVTPGAESTFTAEEEIMVKLAAQGYIPMQAVDWDTIELKRAVAQGLVPEQALRPYIAPYEPLFTQEELATIELAEKGLIPWQTVDWEDVELRRLIDKGLIPRQAAP